MSDYRGTVIEESLGAKDVLKKLKILSTKVEEATVKHKTPWLKRWTLHFVLMPESESWKVAEEISRSLDQGHSGSWYADFRNKTHHYIIFPGKIFFIDRDSKEQYDKAKSYGLSLGIPECQVYFHPEVKVWER
jgi:hypothetical protein